MPPFFFSVIGFVRREWLFILLILFALSCSLYRLTEAPPTWFDEGMIVQLAINLVERGVMGIGVAPGALVSAAYTTTGFPVVWPVAISFAFFGISLLSARLVMVAFLIAFLIASYYFMKRFVGRTSALWSIALLATFASLYGDGKNVLGEVPGLFFLVLFLIFAQNIFDLNLPTRKNAILAGLFFGLCVATKPTFLVLGGAVLIALLFVYFTRGRSAIPFALFPWGVSAALIPILIWLGTQFRLHDDFAQVFSFYANPYYLQHLSSVMGHNAVRFFTESTPLYLLGMLVVWSAAFFLRIRKRAYLGFTEIAAFAFTVFILVAYLRTPGWYRYLFPAQIMGILFFPMSVDALAEHFGEKRFAKLLRLSISMLLALMLILQSYILFFHSWVKEYYNSNNTKITEAYFKTWSPATVFFIYGVPEDVIFLPRGAQYYQYIPLPPAPGRALDIGMNELAVILKGAPDAILASNGLSVASTSELFPGYKEKDRIGKIVVMERKKS